jgi:2-oxoglutarate ferredoxin oxidoreductase subunit delta
MPRGAVVIDVERCKGCGLCIAACPKQILGLSTKVNRSGYTYAQMEDPDACIGCAFCAMTCPDVAIEVYLEKPKARVRNE